MSAGARGLMMAGFVALAMLPSQARAQRSVTPSNFVPLDSLHAPAALAGPVTLNLVDTPLRDAVSALGAKLSIGIAFDPALPGMERSVTVHATGVSAARTLMRLLDGSGVQSMVSPGGSIVLVVRAKGEAAKPMVSGVVTSGTEPLWGARVSLAGTRFETSSDAAGRFTFGNVPSGEYSLRAYRIGYAPVTRAVRIDAESAADPIGVSMEAAAVPVAAVIVTPGYFGVLQPGLATAQTLTRSQIETVPQLGEDAYRAIGRLPGVATSDLSAQFSVRGEPTDALFVTLDGLPLLEPYHLKDLGNALSIIDLSSVGGAELITGGTSAEFGDQTAGVFRLRSVDPRADRTRTTAGISLTNFRLSAQGGFADGRGGWLVAGRRGFLDLAFKLAGIADSLNPKYNDVLAKVTYDSPRFGHLAAQALHAGDQLQYSSTSEPTVSSRYGSDYAWLTLDSHVGSLLRTESVAWVGGISWLKQGNRETARPPIVHIRDSRALTTLGFRQDWSLSMGSRALLKVGADLRHDRARYDYSLLDRDNVLQNHVPVLVTDSMVTDLRPISDRVGLYVSQRVRPIESFTVEVGARYDRASHTGDEIVSPRANFSWQPTRSTTVLGSWGAYAQSQSVFGLQVEDGVTTFAPADESHQTVVGVQQALWNGIAARVETYDRHLSRVRPRYLNGSGETAAFPELAFDRVLIAPTEARARGTELSLERSGGSNMDWSASYVLSSSRQLLNGVWSARPGDQPQALRADWSMHPRSNAWRFTVSEVWHSGWPYTPEAFEVDTISNGQSKEVWVAYRPGAPYSERVPAYQRVDARWTRFVDTRTGRMTLFIDIYNLFNTTNLRGRYTNFSFNGLTAYQFHGTRDNLPRIPSFGISWEF